MNENKTLQSDLFSDDSKGQTWALLYISSEHGCLEKRASQCLSFKIYLHATRRKSPFGKRSRTPQFAYFASPWYYLPVTILGGKILLHWRHLDPLESLLFRCLTGFVSLPRPKSLRARHQLSSPELKAVILSVTLKNILRSSISQRILERLLIHTCVCCYTCGSSYDFSTCIHYRMRRINIRIPKPFPYLSWGVHKQHCLWEGEKTSLSIPCDLILMRTSAFPTSQVTSPGPLSLPPAGLSVSKFMFIGSLVFKTYLEAIRRIQSLIMNT